MHKNLVRLARLIAIALLVFAPLAAAAQDARGTISGTVVDASKSLVPGASVTATHIAMGTSMSAVTNQDGVFQIPYLIPGAYKVTVELSGFKKWVRETVDVRVADRLELEVALEVGGTVEEVTVSAETPLLDTANGSLGNVVDARRIAELPTAHGDPYALIGLAAGVTYTGSARLDRPFEPTHIVGYSMDGTRGNRSDLTIDGVPSTATANAGEVIASYVPPPDIVQEFKVQTATFDAAMGNTEGGVTNLSIKAGSNALKGTVYYGKTPRELFANDYFANANNIPLADFTYNRYGGTAGGPVLFPGYDGRRRTFFMYGFEGIHEARPRNNGTPTVPTEKMRNGDFSELLAIGPQYQIYNPFTRRAAAGGRIQSDPFPGNIIPQSLINPVARKALEYIARPLTTGAADGTGNFQNPSLPESIKYATNTVRIDHNLTQKQRIYGRFSWYDRNSNYNNYFDNLATGEWFKFISRQFAFDHVYVLDSTTVLNLRYGYNYFVRGTDTNPANHGFDLTSLGFPAAYNSAIPDDIRRFPRFDIAGYQGTGFGGEYRPNETNSFIATVTKSKGSHSFRTGMEYRRYAETSEFFANNQTGQFNFDTAWTRGPLDNSTGAPNSLGQSFAAFLLGLPSSGTVSVPASYDEASSTWGFYLQDDWKAGNRLTLNLGLRYEYETALREADNKSVRGFDETAVQPIEAAARGALNSAAPGVPLDQFHVRGGLTFVETLSNPFSGGIQQPQGAALGVQTFLGQSITFFDPDPVSPQMQRWQVGIQREVPGQMVLDVAYVGNKGSQIQTSRNINSTPLQYLSATGVRDQATIDYLSANVPNPFFNLMPVTAGTAFRSATIARERLLRPYPQFDAVNTTTNEGESWYNALQMGLQKRFTAGYTIGVNYTYSQFEEAIDFLNAADPAPLRMISPQDVPHRLSISGIYEIPFGRGRRYGSSANAVTDAVLGGWQFQGIYTYQSGFPINGFGNLLFTGNYEDIALPADQRTLARWFNTDAGFNKVTAQQLASNVRTFPMRFDFVRGHEVNNLDLSVIKNATVAPGRMLQFRFESLNALNHPLFPSPSGNSLTPTAVQFGSIVSSTQLNYARRTQVTVKFIF